MSWRQLTLKLISKQPLRLLLETKRKTFRSGTDLKDCRLGTALRTPKGSLSVPQRRILARSKQAYLGSVQGKESALQTSFPQAF